MTERQWYQHPAPHYKDRAWVYGEPGERSLAVVDRQPDGRWWWWVSFSKYHGFEPDLDAAKRAALAGLAALERAEGKQR